MQNKPDPRTVTFRFFETASFSNMRKQIVNFVFLALVSSLASTSLADDEVTRHSAKRAVKGKIEKLDQTKIVIKPRSGAAVTIPVDDIIKIRFNGEPAGLNLARTSERNGAFQRALEGFNAAKEKADSKNKNLAIEIDFLIARATSKMASSSAEKAKEAMTLLTNFTNANKSNIRYFEAVSLLGSLHLQTGDVAAARQAIAPLANAPVKSFKMTAGIIEGRALLAEGKAAEAAAAFEQAASAAGNDPSAKAKGLEALLGKAICQQKQQQYKPAIETLNQVLDKTDVSNTAVQAEAYLRRGDVFRDQQQNKDAVFEYLHVDLLFRSHTALHAEALFNLSSLWAATGHPDRAAEAKATLMSDYAASRWAKKLAGG